MAIFISTSVLISILFIYPSNSLFFNITSFDSNTNNMFYAGDATFNNGSIELNRMVNLCRVGRAMFSKQVQMYDPSTKQPSDFTTTFSFTVDTLNNTNYGDGFSFFIAPAGSSIPINSAGGFQGLYNTTTLGFFSENQIVAVEFDSRVNTEFDPPYEHVGINVNSLASPWVMVGFSAATGMVGERHAIHTWEFNSTFDAKPITNQTSSMNFILDKGAWPRKFSHQELLKATNYFSDEKTLGQGGFGSVYKGVLEELNNMEIAVKRFSNKSKQGKKEYLTEVLIISSLRHRNLVRLIGWCHEDEDFMLVYELMPNGSLDTHLFGNVSTTLTWCARYKIANGLASALLYLHEEWEQCVIHRDIKASNVMLDSGFKAKLGDFGVARLMGHEVSRKTTALAGTWGYLAPEYISKGKASKECDMYSFGIVSLEIGCGRRTVEHNVEESRVSLLEWVWSLYGQGRVLDAADERLGQVFDRKEMETLLVVGLWCAHPDHTLRPSIKEAIQVLNFEANLPHLPLAIPVLVYGTPLIRLDHSGQGSISLSSSMQLVIVSPIISTRTHPIFKLVKSFVISNHDLPFFNLGHQFNSSMTISAHSEIFAIP